MFRAASLSLLLFREDVIVVRWQQSLIGWLLVGLIAGWLAGKLSRGRGYGCITDVILGVLGAFIGGWIFGKLGIFGGGFIYSLAAATVGAVVLVGVVHLLGGGSKD
jgi:uncharacterized membrane protein YeaQ/YmgE (transglycosylase-associated protein family)